MKKTKLHEELPWEEFLERYLVNHEEFTLWLNNQKINICYGRNGTFSYNIIVDKKKIVEKEFKSPKELLEKARFGDKLLKDIWTILE